MRSFVTLFLAVAFATICGKSAPLIQDRGVEADLLSRFKLMAQYASATYCPSNYGSAGDRITCAPGSCPLVEGAESTSLVEYSRTETSTDVTGFIAVDHTNDLVVIAFRGSKTVDSWLTDLDIGTTETDICSGCTAHNGFWNSWVDARDRVLSCVKETSMKYPAYQIAVAGHSLGGAIATLAAAHLRNSGYNATLYSFGSPRIGGTKISTYITNQTGGNYRITHWNDPVPRMPLVIMGYVHISPEYYINKPNNQEVQCNDIKKYEGAVNFKGNSAWIAVDVQAHEWYFDNVATCDAKKTKRGLELRALQSSVEILDTF